jgi:hypothetical protein
MSVPSVPEAPAALVCWSCKSPVEAADRYCRHCGSGLGAFLPWYYQPWGLGVLALFAMGPLVLPMLWKSPAVSRRGKLIGTFLLGLLTLWLVKGFYNLVQSVNSVLSTDISALKI